MFILISCAKRLIGYKAISQTQNTLIELPVLNPLSPETVIHLPLHLSVPHLPQQILTEHTHTHTHIHQWDWSSCMYCEYTEELIIHTVLKVTHIEATHLQWGTLYQREPGRHLVQTSDALHKEECSSSKSHYITDLPHTLPVNLDPAVIVTLACFNASLISLSKRSLHSKNDSRVTGVPWNLA